VAAGMPSYKHGPAETAIDDTIRMLDQLAMVLDSVVINAKQGLAEVNDDYSTTTELADVLQRQCDVPFRIGHHFASELVTYGREHHLRSAELPYDEAQRIYTRSATTFGLNNATLPLDEASFRRALTPENMINSARVVGGPQPAEVTRMLKEEQASIDYDRQWSLAKRQKLAAAQSSLDSAFNALSQP
jgi:argininosuccinate lyase